MSRNRWGSSTTHVPIASSRDPRHLWNVLVLTMLTLSSLTVQMYQARYLLLSKAVAYNSICQIVPMEETVRAFSWVIEKGWVRFLYPQP